MLINPVRYTDDKRLLLLRIINGWAKYVSDSSIYLTPEIEKARYGIDEVLLRQVLYELNGLGHIDINQEPNNALSQEQKLRRDDEEDYFLISLNDSFYDYYKAAENSVPDEKSLDGAMPAPMPPFGKQKVTYDKKTSQLSYGDFSIAIRGPLQTEVCKQVFRNRKQPALFNEILEKVDHTKHSRAVSDAVMKINAKIQEAFDLKDVLYTRNEKAGISKNYL